jgi:hypothetical protein
MIPNASAGQRRQICLVAILVTIAGCKGANVEVGHTYTVAQVYGSRSPCFPNLMAYQEYRNLLRSESKDKADVLAAMSALWLNTGDRVTVLDKSNASGTASLKLRIVATGKTCYAANVGSGPDGLFSK